MVSLRDYDAARMACGPRIYFALPQNKHFSLVQSRSIAMAFEMQQALSLIGGRSMSTSQMYMYKYLSRTLDGAQDCLPGISDRGVCPGAACWHGWLPHDLVCLVPDERKEEDFLFQLGKIE